MNNASITKDKSNASRRVGESKIQPNTRPHPSLSDSIITEGMPHIWSTISRDYTLHQAPPFWWPAPKDKPQHNWFWKSMGIKTRIIM